MVLIKHRKCASPLLGVLCCAAPSAAGHAVVGRSSSVRCWPCCVAQFGRLLGMLCCTARAATGQAVLRSSAGCYACCVAQLGATLSMLLFCAARLAAGHAALPCCTTPGPVTHGPGAPMQSTWSSGRDSTAVPPGSMLTCCALSGTLCTAPYMEHYVAPTMHQAPASCVYMHMHMMQADGARAWCPVGATLQVRYGRVPCS